MCALPPVTHGRPARQEGASSSRQCLKMTFDTDGEWL